MTLTRYKDIDYEAELTDVLSNLSWEKNDIRMIGRRIAALAASGEGPTEIGVRLNPEKVKQPSWTPEQWRERERALRASPPLGLELSLRVRDARNRHRI